MKSIERTVRLVLFKECQESFKMLEMFETEITHIDFGGVCVQKCIQTKNRGRGPVWTMGFHKCTIYRTSWSNTDLTIKEEN